MNHIITISREFGSGGRELGKRLAEALNIAYYDKEIVAALAQESGLAEQYIEGISEKGISFYYPITYANTMMMSTDMFQSRTQLFVKQNELLKSLADKSDCVIVGRAADVILEDYDPLRIFVYADMDSKIKRCKEREEGEVKSDKEYMKKIKEVDKGRTKYRDILSDTKWGDRKANDLMINTSNLEIKSLIPTIVAYQEAYFKNR